jgi:hypothetical protein
MIKRILAGIAAAAITVTAYAIPAHASARPVNWAQRTCTAFAAWGRHPTTANLDTLASDSFRVPWRYLGNDIWALYSDVRSGSVKYVSDDEQQTYTDCHNGYGL